MITEYKIGYLAHFMVLKAMPDYDSYLTKILNSEVLALLPRRYARKEYKIGETGFASIYDIKGARVTLTQRSPQYVRRTLEYLLADLLARGGITIKRSSIVIGKYIKVAIDLSDNGGRDIKDSYELGRMLEPHIRDIRLGDYFSEKLSFVRYSSDIKKFTVNALCPPGVLDAVKLVTLHGDREVHVMVDKKYLGLFIGKGGTNLALVSKMCNLEKIEIKGIEEEVINRYQGR